MQIIKNLSHIGNKYIISYITKRNTNKNICGKGYHAFLGLSVRADDGNYHLMKSYGISQDEGGGRSGALFYGGDNAINSSDPISYRKMKVEVYAEHFPVSYDTASDFEDLMSRNTKSKHFWLMKRNCHNFASYVLSRLGIIDDVLIKSKWNFTPVRNHLYTLQRVLGDNGFGNYIISQQHYAYNKKYVSGSSKKGETLNFDDVECSRFKWPLNIVITRQLRFTPEDRYLKILEKAPHSNLPLKARMNKARALLKSYCDNLMMHRRRNYVNAVKALLLKIDNDEFSEVHEILEHAFEEIADQSNFKPYVHGGFMKRLSCIKFLLERKKLEDEPSLDSILRLSYDKSESGDASNENDKKMAEIDQTIDLKIKNFRSSLFSSNKNKIKSLYEAYICNHDLNRKRYLYQYAMNNKYSSKNDMKYHRLE
ncbi:MAG: hypothetical protein GY750_20715 [Lentisphaerae bacterium]|nr:hypothetical protein [Lentisphaerota bacterium]MCP4103814.1 hypothetical protein [Lentisphaerota bacterium]